MIEFILGIWTPLSTTLTPASVSTSPNKAGNLPSRSRIGNRARLPVSSRSVGVRWPGSRQLTLTAGKRSRGRSSVRAGVGVRWPGLPRRWWWLILSAGRRSPGQSRIHPHAHGRWPTLRACLLSSRTHDEADSNPAPSPLVSASALTCFYRRFRRPAEFWSQASTTRCAAEGHGPPGAAPLTATEGD